MTIMVFDIETIPDVAAGRRLLALEDAPLEAVIDAMQAKRRAQQNHEFMAHHMQQIVAISVVVAHQDWVKVWSLGQAQDTEKTLIERFFAGLDRYQPTLVSWNGGGFDLPVLHYRALIHNVSSASYWDNGELDKEFKWNNYLSRFHSRHLDLMDVLSGYQAQARAPLDDIACLLGLPGKMGMKGDQVLTCFLKDDRHSIRNYCETDVLNTYLIYLRFQKIRGRLSAKAYQDALAQLAKHLLQTEKEHLHSFCAKWQR